MHYCIDSLNGETYNSVGYVPAAMADDFGSLLGDLITDAGMNRADFAHRAHVSASFVSNVIHDDRSPPPDALERWADLLALRGRKREHFLDMAMLRHLPAEVRPRWIALLHRLEAVEDRFGKT